MAFNTTTVATLLATKWSKDIIAAEEKNFVMKPRVANRSGELKLGTVLRVPLRTHLTAGTVTAATGAYTAVDVTDTYSDVTIDTWDHATIRIIDNIETMADRDVAKLYAPEQGYALAAKIDTALLANYASFSEAGGGSVSDVSLDLAIIAAATLDNSDVPRNERYGVLSPLQYWKLLGETSVSDSSVMGNGKSALLTGKLPVLCGFEWFSSTNVPTSTTRKNFVWHKSAIAIAISNEVKMEKVRVSDALATDYRCWQLYGIKVERTDHGLILATTNTN